MVFMSPSCDRCYGNLVRVSMLIQRNSHEPLKSAAEIDPKPTVGNRSYRVYRLLRELIKVGATAGQSLTSDSNSISLDTAERLLRQVGHLNVAMNRNITAISAPAMTAIRKVWSSGVLECSHREPDAGIINTPATISRYRNFKRSRIVMRGILRSGLSPEK